MNLQSAKQAKGSTYGPNHQNLGPGLQMWSKIGQNWHFHKVPKGPYLDRANHQVVRFKGQMVQNEVIFEVSQEVQKWSKWPKFEVSGMGLRGPNRSSSPKAACKGPSRSLPQGPSKGVQMVKIRSNLGSLRVPPRSIRAKGTNRHILSRGQNLGSGGLKMGQNGVKMAFSLTPDRQNDQNWLFQ